MNKAADTRASENVGDSVEPRISDIRINTLAFDGMPFTTPAGGKLLASGRT